MVYRMSIEEMGPYLKKISKNKWLGDFTQGLGKNMLAPIRQFEWIAPNKTLTKTNPYGSKYLLRRYFSPQIVL